MYTFFLPLLMGAPQGGDAAGGTGGDFLSTFIFIIPMILIFYFLLIRPQSKKRKEAEKMHAGLKKGDRIVTIGGLYGTIQSVRDTTVIIKADDNVKLEFMRSAISSVVSQSSSRDDSSKDDEYKIKEDDYKIGDGGSTNDNSSAENR
ncbi:MAG: preprotein translocase subunit YajC [Treponema sp.]|nr:preprotein translocase subunit YajC [Treponema sp.]